MKQWMKLMAVSGLVIGLAACAHQQTASTAVNAPTSGKFANGPHAGLLGERQYYFACNSSLLPQSYQSAAQAQASFLKAHPKAMLVLQGYADSAGSSDYNLAVAQQRAASVANYLRLQGVSGKQLQLVSYGDLSNSPYTGTINKQNCRVDLVYQTKH